MEDCSQLYRAGYHGHRFQPASYTTVSETSLLYLYSDLYCGIGRSISALDSAYRRILPGADADSRPESVVVGTGSAVSFQADIHSEIVKAAHRWVGMGMDCFCDMDGHQCSWTVVAYLVFVYVWDILFDSIQHRRQGSTGKGDDRRYDCILFCHTKLCLSVPAL